MQRNSTSRTNCSQIYPSYNEKLILVLKFFFSLGIFIDAMIVDVRIADSRIADVKIAGSRIIDANQ